MCLVLMGVASCAAQGVAMAGATSASTTAAARHPDAARWRTDCAPNPFDRKLVSPGLRQETVMPQHQG
jgi:hypothetical protein